MTRLEEVKDLLGWSKQNMEKLEREWALEEKQLESHIKLKQTLKELEMVSATQNLLNEKRELFEHEQKVGLGYLKRLENELLVLESLAQTGEQERMRAQLIGAMR